MRKVSFLRLVWIALLLFIQGAHGATRLAILAEGEARAVADLLTVRLSAEAEVALVERAEIDRIVAEQKLVARGLAEAVQLGRLLRADGVLVLSQIAQPHGSALACRLVAVETGVILDSQLAPPALKDPGEWVPALAEAVHRAQPKLEVRAVQAVPISVAGLRASAGLEADETPFAALLIHALAQQPGFVVLERHRLDALAQEKEFGPDVAAPFWSSRLLLGGSLERDPERPDGLLVKARLQPPRGVAIEFSVTGARANPGALAQDVARRTAEALRQPWSAAPWDAGAEAGRFAREARAAYAVGLWELAESAAGAAWALGRREAELARLRYRIEFERLVSLDFNLAPWVRAERLGMDRLTHGCRRFADVQYAPPDKAPFAPFRFPEDLVAALRLLDLQREFAALAPRVKRGRHEPEDDLCGAKTLYAASIPFVLAHRRAEAVDCGAQLAELKERLDEALARFLASEPSARQLEEIRYVQGYFALFRCGNADTCRQALGALLAEDAKGDPARLQLRVGLLEALAAAPLYIAAPWPADVCHEIGLTRSKALTPDDRLFALAMLDPQRVDPAERRALAAGWPEQLWGLRDTFVAEPDATRAFADKIVRRLTVGWTDRDESGAVLAALQDVRRRLFLHVVASHGRADAFDFWNDLSFRNWNETDAAVFNQALLAHLAEVEATLGLRHGETQRFVRWQAELRARFPALPGPESRESAPLRVTRFWNPYAATPLAPATGEQGFRIWGQFKWFDGRVWFHAEMQRKDRSENRAAVRAFIVAVEPRTGATELFAVPNLGGMNEGQPFADFTVTPDFLLVVKNGAPLLKLRRATGEWKAFEQFRHGWPPPVVAGREAFISLETEIARLDLETDTATTLVRTRREPAESPLDDARHLRVWTLAGPDGLPIVQAADVVPNGQTSASFRFDPATGGWEKRAPFYADERAIHRCVLDPEARERWETRGEKRGLAYVRTEETAGQRSDAVCPIPLEFAISEADGALLTSRERLTGKAPLRTIATGLEAAEKTIETPDGLILFRFMAPGFWFVPKEDLARYVAVHGTPIDPHSIRNVR
ncbi:MAG: hypothetical protein QOE70_3569 [Chthoniobacter sp.]|jgi:hypothetical protein|nr:hypothetical protein [Chthoniobacter sp.]